MNAFCSCHCARCADPLPANADVRVDPYLSAVYGTKEETLVCDACFAEIEASANKYIKENGDRR